jgi:hypothetical protein
LNIISTQDSKDGAKRYKIMGGNVSNNLNITAQKLYSKDEIYLFNSSYKNGVSELEYSALLSLFEQTNGNEWKDRSNWCTAHDVGVWKGVRVENGHVTELNLYSNNLHGVLPLKFYNLPCLRLLELGANRIHGELSERVNHLISLRVLALNANQLSGFIPYSLAEIEPLDEVLLRQNQLTGTIPNSLLLREALTLETSENNLEASDNVAIHTPQWEWYLMHRDIILSLDRIPSHETAKSNRWLYRMNCLFKAYGHWSFESDRGGHIAVNRNAIALFSHRWDKPSTDAAIAHPDRDDNSKLAHIKAFLIAHSEIKLFSWITGRCLKLPLHGLVLLWLLWRLDRCHFMFIMQVFFYSFIYFISLFYLLFVI